MKNAHPWEILNGDCRDAMALLIDADSVDSIVTDPPYELGFMGKGWDSSGIANDVQVWREAFRVLKPGGHLLAFSGTRTYHRMVCAIEDAGFEIRDQVGWVYGSGFPKSLDVSKAIDKAAGAVRLVTRAASEEYREGVNVDWDQRSSSRERRDEPATDAAKQWQGWGTALKPAWEPIVVARKPLIGTVAANVLAHGTGALNIDACRVPHSGAGGSWGAGKRPGGFGDVGAEKGGSEPCGAFNDAGRWPANLIHDGSPEVVALFPREAGAAAAKVKGTEPSDVTDGIYNERGRVPGAFHGDTGSAARFFYCAKASRKDRNEGCDGFERKPLNWSSGTKNPGSFQAEGTDRTSPNNHPTVKPTDLMRYLCRLVTPPGGMVLDPFTGSGSTGKAAVLEGFRFVGCELSEEYARIAEARIAAAAATLLKAAA